jgi:ubiquitin carboxyl-terminal hydrolase 36/42
LQIPNSRHNIGLKDCLTEYVGADRLCGDNKYSCNGCKRKVNALKMCSIETLPNILIIDFVRYNVGRKNSEIIEYPLELNLNRYLSDTIDEHNAKRLKSNKNL